MKHTYCIVGPSANENTMLAANLEKLYGMKQGSDVKVITPSEIAAMRKKTKIPVVAYLHSASGSDCIPILEKTDMIFRLPENMEPEKFANLVYREICSYEIDTINEALCAIDENYAPWIYMEWPANTDPDLPLFKWTEGGYTSEPNYSLDETSDSAYRAAKYRAVRPLLRITPPTSNARLLQNVGAEAVEVCSNYCETEDLQIAKEFCDKHKAVDICQLQQGMDDFYDAGLTLEQMDAVDNAFFSYTFLWEKAGVVAQ